MVCDGVLDRVSLLSVELLRETIELKSSVFVCVLLDSGRTGLGDISLDFVTETVV